MNYRLQVYGFKPGRDPDQDLADHTSSYHHSKYQTAYLDFLAEKEGGRIVQLYLIDLDNRNDFVLVDDSRWGKE